MSNDKQPEKIFALLGCYAAQIACCLPTCWGNLSVQFWRAKHISWTAWALKVYQWPPCNDITSIKSKCICWFFIGGNSPPPQWARASSFMRFLDHTKRRITVGRTPLDGWLARRRNLYLTNITHTTDQHPFPSVALEPTISAGERPQTNALDRAVTGCWVF